MNEMINRRKLLQAGGALIVAFSLPMARAATPAAEKTLSPARVDGFLAVAHDGTVTVYSGKVDLGTGVRTALTQIVADELDVPMNQITIIEGDTALTPDQGTTSGSFSIQNGGMQLRRAAATARRALLRRAAAQMDRDISTLLIRNGVVTAAGGEGLPIGSLVEPTALALDIEKDAPQKAPGDYTIVGKPVRRLDIPDKVDGRFTFMQDFTMPGMLHGRVVRPSGFGATLVSYDESSIADIPGIVKIVRISNFLGVLAKSEWSAIKAAEQLKVTWSSWSDLPDQSKIWEHVRNTPVVHDDVTSRLGSSRAVLGAAPRKLRSTYDFAIHTHGSIGPSCAVATFTDGKLTCWTASQATHDLRKQLAAMLALSDADVRCVYVEGAGCYGRNGHEDAAADAALLARAAGTPVRVQWMRADEHGWDPKGPPTLLDMRAGVDPQGNLAAWESELFVPDGSATFVPLTGAELAGLNSLGKLSPGGVLNDLSIPYDIPNVTTTAHRLQSTPLRPAWIRSPGRLQNTFANESFLDEIAASIGADPLDIRLQHLEDARGKELLERLAKLSKWRERREPDRNAEVVTGRGLAYVKYELVRTYVGAVADVEINRKTGALAVKRFYVAHDCGQIINPDGLRNQIEGCVVQTVSRILKEEVTFDRSMVTSLDWASYPILTFPEIPEIVIDLIDRPQEVPWGGGEPTCAVVPSAIAGAVFEATGVRLRSVPFTPRKVLAVLRAS
ncbi:xanthine dehydrogenase family protein molybdopterin-binding subunit [Bradyrhizobium canariense]|uniref:xanthine dehydrogenase family protein molybdopterin-binding subunit n=1 Tax=Bradyrhizobium canariense TaxID=255045 RepID=UPI000A194C09|nr:molybdopterin cofactor-binding domain-containing protein [Bradyrhizobium canariense]OSI22476.1 isoquinoline 1-oxidoreductase [Bradyrhizobium canariense]OSI28091.1 isoquinoline 1-oxidoreductase [Bradyrhizobium canariense]OSI46160.1 isoquinoline 1-oxidoreductase [Bradyrhizobium canariense]OSI48479.1 isoquinoline 1-oxidoreductase [Bradyrhizobium canariense]OSI53516.1 isoquinoline 1-oxidoreductase [Bradyrhizobium canariense]